MKKAKYKKKTLKEVGKISGVTALSIAFAANPTVLMVSNNSVVYGASQINQQVTGVLGETGKTQSINFTGGEISNMTVPKIPGFVFDKAVLDIGNGKTLDITEITSGTYDNKPVVLLNYKDNGANNQLMYYADEASKMSAKIRFLYRSGEQLYGVTYNKVSGNMAQFVSIEKGSDIADSGTNYIFYVSSTRRDVDITVKANGKVLQPINNFSSSTNQILQYEIQNISQDTTIDVSGESQTEHTISFNKTSFQQVYENLLKPEYGAGSGRVNILPVDGEMYKPINGEKLITNSGGKVSFRISVQGGKPFISNQGLTIGSLSLLTLKLNGENVSVPTSPVEDFLRADVPENKQKLQDILGSGNDMQKNWKKAFLESQTLKNMREAIGKEVVTTFDSGNNAGIKATVKLSKIYPHPIALSQDPKVQPYSPNNGLNSNNFRDYINNRIDRLGYYVPSLSLENNFDYFTNPNYTLEAKDMYGFSPISDGVSANDIVSLNGGGTIWDKEYLITLENVTQDVDVSFIASMLNANVANYVAARGIESIGATQTMANNKGNEDYLHKAWPTWPNGSGSNTAYIFLKNGYTNPKVTVDSNTVKMQPLTVVNNSSYRLTSSDSNPAGISVNVIKSNNGAMSVTQLDHSSGEVGTFVIDTELVKLRTFFDLNGGTSSKIVAKDNNQYDVINNNNIKMPAAIPTRPGYVFKGWKVSNASFLDSADNDKLFMPNEILSINKLKITNSIGETQIDGNLINIQAQYEPQLTSNGFYSVNYLCGIRTLQDSKSVMGAPNLLIRFDDPSEMVPDTLTDSRGFVYKLTPESAKLKAENGFLITDEGININYEVDTTQGKFKELTPNLNDEQKSFLANNFDNLPQDDATINQFIQNKLVDYNTAVGNLNNLINNTEAFKKTPQYADAENKQVYDDAIAQGKAALKAEIGNASYVNNAVNSINTAIGQLRDITPLEKLVQGADAVRKSPEYYNASFKDKFDYEGALDAAQSMLDDPTQYSQSEINEQVASIQKILGALDGKPTDFTPLKDAIEKAEALKGDPSYYNDTPSGQSDFNNAINTAKSILNKPGVTNDQVAAAVSALEGAESKLSGQPTDFGPLNDYLKQIENAHQNPKYFNADSQYQDIFNTQLDNAKKLLKNQKATNNDVATMVQALKTAYENLNGQPTDLSGLKAEIAEEPNVQATPQYYNGTDASKQAYTQAIATAKQQLSNPLLTNKQAEALKNAITQAKDALDGTATNTAPLEALVNGSNDEKAKHNYYNATDEQKKAYNDAIAEGQRILDNPKATNAQVQSQVNAINEALKNLQGQPTNTQPLTDATNEKASVENTPAYYNATEEQRNAYDQAVKEGLKGLKDSDLTQAEADALVNAINAAKAKLAGTNTDFSGLKSLTDGADALKATSKYYNSPVEQQKAYNKAISDGLKVLSNDKATQKEVNDAISAINSAIDALSGKNTNTEDLQNLINQESATKDNFKYYNAPESAKTAYDQAIASAKNTLENSNPLTQSQVDNAIAAINKAVEGLNGSATNDEALKTLVGADSGFKETSQYYNGTTDQQNAYNNAIEYGKQLLENPKLTQQQVDDAVNKINAAKEGLKGQPTNKEALQQAVGEAPTVEGGNKYYNADPDLQKAYREAVAQGNTVLGDENSTQAQVDSAKSAIEKAKEALNGAPTNTEALQQAINEQLEVHKTPAYFNGSDSQQKDYDSAVAAAKAALENPNISDAQVEKLLDKINKAKDALGGNATNTEALKEAIGQEQATKENSKYFNADPSKQQAYEKAITEAKKLLENPQATQKQVNTALENINNAIGELDGQPTNLDDLKAAIAKKDAVQGTPEYFNGSQESKNAYNKAIEDAENQLSNPLLTDDQAEALLNAINRAEEGLNGEPTNVEPLKILVDNAPAVHKTPKYFNGTQDKQSAYDAQIQKAKELLKNPKATQAEVQQAFDDVTKALAGLNGEETDLTPLENLVNNVPSVEKTPAYYNATPEQQAAYKQAIADIKEAIKYPLLTNEQVALGVAHVEKAINALGGQPTNFEPLKTAVEDSTATKNTPSYYNADKALRDAYDKAVAHGKALLGEDGNGKAGVSNKEVEEAVKAIEEAKKALNGQATNTDALKNAVKEAPEVEKTPNYFNGTPEAQEAYKNAIAAGEAGLKNPDLSNAQAEKLLEDINNAKAGLTGTPTDTEGLKALVDESPNIMLDPKYFNGTDEEKEAYNQAINKGKNVLLNPVATNAQVAEAIKEINEAKAKLTGEPTNTDDLQKAVNEEPQVESSPAYYNGSKEAQNAYNQAIKNAEEALKNKYLTNEQAQKLLDDINTAKAALQGEATNKGDLQNLVNEADEVKDTPKYYNSSAQDQVDYDNAIKAAEKVLADPNATQADVNSAAESVKQAKDKLQGSATNTSSLDDAIKRAEEAMKTPKYYNGTQETTKALDDALDEAKKQLTNPKLTEAQAEKLASDIDKAIAGLDGQDTNFEPLKDAVKASETTVTTPKYYNATEEQKQAYNDAVSKANKVLGNPSATQAQVDAAKEAIEQAEAGLGGTATDNTPLKDAIKAGNEAKETPKYYNGSEEANKALNQALAEGEALMNNPSATNEQVKEVAKKITDAINGLNGENTDLTPLQNLVDKNDEVKAGSSYYNSAPALQSAYDDAISQGEKVLEDPSATNKEVSEAVDKINKALEALNGKTTNLEPLENLVNKANDVRNTPEYYNGSQADKDAYDKAIEAGEEGLKDKDLTQDEADSLSKAIEDALGKLKGSPTSNGDLKSLVEQAPEVVKDSKYYNASPENQNQYNQAITAGQSVLDNPKATQEQVNKAVEDIQNALNNLTGKNTDMSKLQEAVNKAKDVMESPKYFNGDSKDQLAYDDAIKAAKDILAQPNTPQSVVDSMINKIKEAEDNLKGVDTNKEALKNLVDQANQIKEDYKYYNATPEAQKAYDDAIAKAQEDLSNNLLSQKDADADVASIQDAINGLLGQPTSKDKLGEALEKEKDVISSYPYYNGTKEAQDAYNQAVEEGKALQTDPNATQEQIDKAVENIENAEKNLGGTQTDKSQLDKLLEQAKEALNTPKYYNSNDKLQEALNQALAQGTVVANTTDATQDVVNQAVESLTKALNALDGENNNFSKLQSLIKEAEKAMGTYKYINGSKAAQDKLDAALNTAKALMNTSGIVTQNRIDSVARILEEAIDGLDGKKANTSGLQDFINSHQNTEKKPEYTYATDKEKEDYNQALKDAESLLNDPNASQESVDKALTNLENAYGNLKGQAPKVENKGNSNSGKDGGKSAKTGDTSDPFGKGVAIGIFGSMALLLKKLKRKNKHS